MMGYLLERAEFILTILGAAAVKLILTISEDPPEDETAKGRRKRAQRMWAGIMAGLLAAWVGTPAIINNTGWAGPEDQMWLAALLVVTGEHVMRRLLAPGDLIDRLLNRTIGRNNE